MSEQFDQSAQPDQSEQFDQPEQPDQPKKPATIRPRTIGDLIALVPYLLGFHPSNSIVALANVGGGPATIARADLPGTAETTAVTARHIAAFAAPQAGAVILIGYGSSEDVGPVLDAAAVACAAVQVLVAGQLRVTDGRYYNLGGDRPDQGTPIGGGVSATAADAVFHGMTALPDRRAVERQLEPVGEPDRSRMRDATDRAAVRLLGLYTGSSGGSREKVQATAADAASAALTAALATVAAGGVLSDDDVAWFTVVLGAPAARDVIWAQISGDPVERAMWTDVVRRGVPSLIAAPAAFLATTAYLAGNGALANVAVARALQCDPGYRMARMLADAFSIPITPQDLWRMLHDPDL